MVGERRVGELAGAVSLQEPAAGRVSGGQSDEQVGTWADGPEPHPLVEASDTQVRR